MCSIAEREHAVQGAIADCRVDGRQRLDFRPMSVQVKTCAFSIGSATAQVSSSAAGASTTVIAAVSCDVGAAPTSDDDDPPRGRLLFHVDSSSAFETSVAKRAEGEAALVRQLERAYGTNPADTVPLEDVAAVAVPRLTRPPPSVADRVARVLRRATSEASASALLRELALEKGHCFDLHIDVQVLSATAGNVVGVTAAAVRAALMDTVLPTATISVAADGETTAVHLDNRKPSKALAASASACAPLIFELVCDPTIGIYVADPSAVEEAALPVKVSIAVAPGRRDQHEVRWCDVTGRRSAQSETAASIGIAAPDLASLLAEASSALAASMGDGFQQAAAGVDSLSAGAVEFR